MSAAFEEHNLQLLNERVSSLLENEQYEHAAKDNLAFSFDKPQDLLESDTFSLLLKPASFSKTLDGHTGEVRSVAFSPDSKLLASASSKTVRLWNIPNGDLNAELKGHKSYVYSVTFSPDGKSIVSGSWDKTVRIWSVATKQQVQILKGHSNDVNSVAWSPNGDVIASDSYDRTVILWDTISGSMKKKLTGHKSNVVSASFTQNGSKLVSSENDTVIIWDVNSGAALNKLPHSDGVWSVCFSLDDQFVVTGCGDKIVRMSDVNTGHEEKRFEGHTNAVSSIAFSFDDSIIASGSCDNSVRLHQPSNCNNWMDTPTVSHQLRFHVMANYGISK